MPDFRSRQFQSSLADTVVWCKMKAIGMDADSDDIRQRHALYIQAEQLWEEAQETVKRRWLRREISDTEQWQKAMALLGQIRDSLGPMDRNLRSPVSASMSLETMHFGRKLSLKLLHGVRD
jgi:hypothetical protein